MRTRVLAFVMAGGRGERLDPLTRHRTKPAVPFGRYRLIDFVLSNLVNSDVTAICVLTQYTAQSVPESFRKEARRRRVGYLSRHFSCCPLASRVASPCFGGNL